jgi:tRNA(Ile)-lysidine synthase
MARHGIEHHVLIWRGEKPANARQQAARVARYRLLCGWCRDSAILHLLIGHHADDQAETVLHRLIRGSGIDGLAGMSAIVDTAEVRLLRPLLGCRATDLRLFLRHRGEAWVEDPSNQDARFARTHLRAARSSLEIAGLGQPLLLAAAARMSSARAAMQEAVVALLARCCRVHPMGFALLDRNQMTAAPVEIGAKALARTVTMIGGAVRECAPDRARRSYERLFRADGGKIASLGRCLLVGDGSRLLVCREHRDLPAPRILKPDEDILWDGRFRLKATSAKENTGGAWYVRPLRSEDWRTIHADAADLPTPEMPALVWGTLPVLCDETGLVSAPHFAYVRKEWAATHPQVATVAWRPRNGITGAGYFLL